MDPVKSLPAAAATCHVCQAPCSSKAHLALHMLQAHSSNKTDENSRKPALQTSLGFQAVTAKSIKTAIPTVEAATASNLTPFPCCLCDLVMYSRLHLETHTRVHTQEKPLGKKEGFPCEDSGKSTIQLSYLVFLLHSNTLKLLVDPPT